MPDKTAAARRSRVGFHAAYSDAKFFFMQARANASLNTLPKHAEMTWSPDERGWVIEIVDGSGTYALPCRHCGSIGLDGDDHTCPCPKRDDECRAHVGWKAYR
jgi:hypothetical protein